LTRERKSILRASLEGTSSVLYGKKKKIMARTVGTTATCLAKSQSIKGHRQIRNKKKGHSRNAIGRIMIISEGRWLEVGGDLDRTGGGTSLGYSVSNGGLPGALRVPEVRTALRKKEQGMGRPDYFEGRECRGTRGNLPKREAVDGERRRTSASEKKKKNTKNNQAQFRE